MATSDAAIRRLIKALKDVRTEKGLTIAQVAEASGVDKSVVSRFENETTDPQFSTLLRYADAVGVYLLVDIVPKDRLQKLDTRILENLDGLRLKFPKGLRLDR